MERPTKKIQLRRFVSETNEYQCNFTGSFEETAFVRQFVAEYRAIQKSLLEGGPGVITPVEEVPYKRVYIDLVSDDDDDDANDNNVVDALDDDGVDTLDEDDANYDNGVDTLDDDDSNDNNAVEREDDASEEGWRDDSAFDEFGDEPDDALLEVYETPDGVRLPYNKRVVTFGPALDRNSEAFLIYLLKANKYGPQIKKSAHGYGLFAERDYAAGEDVTMYGGVYRVREAVYGVGDGEPDDDGNITNRSFDPAYYAPRGRKTFHDAEGNPVSEYLLELNRIKLYGNKTEYVITRDAKYKFGLLCKGRWVNEPAHVDQANVTFDVIEGDGLERWDMVVCTSRPVKEGEEFLTYYGNEYIRDYSIEGEDDSVSSEE
jgi:hypothetical protein